MTSLRIGDRVRSLSSGRLGTIEANPYWFEGHSRAGVTWDELPGIWVRPTLDLVRLDPRPSVPPEARPLSTGVLASPERRPR